MLNNFFDKYIFAGNLKYKHNNFFLMGIPFAMLPTRLFLFEKFADDAEFNKKVYYSVKDAMVKALRSEFGIDFKLEGQSGLSLVEQFFTASGFGLISQSDADHENKRALMVVTNSPVAQALNEKSKHPVDHMLRGVFAGVFTVFFEAKVDCVETECAALGQGQCKFVVKQNHEFDFSNEIVRSQIDAHD